MPFDNCPADVKAQAKAHLRAMLHACSCSLVVPLPEVWLVCRGENCIKASQDGHAVLFSKELYRVEMTTLSKTAKW